MRILPAFALILGLCLGLGSATSANGAGKAEPVRVVDISGRSVELGRPAERVLLGEGRFIAALSLLAPEEPVARIAGMLNDFRRLDPDGFARYLEVFPELDEVPVFGQTSVDSVNVETALLLAPDAAVFGLSGHGPSPRSPQIVERLEAAGIPVVFIDFRDDPIRNTAQSMRILGQVLGLEAEAEAFAAFHDAEVARIVERVAALAQPRPSVFLEAVVGLRDECCFTIARGMFASFIEAAGGRNIAAGKLPGMAGTLSLEFVIDQDPDIYIGTAVGQLKDGRNPKGRIVLGSGSTEAFAATSLASAVARPGIASLTAVRERRAYGIWHHFYNSPLNLFALQRFATWFHPAAFGDVDPEATLAEMLARMGAVDLDGVYAVSLDSAQ